MEPHSAKAGKRGSGKVKESSVASSLRDFIATMVFDPYLALNRIYE